MRLLPVVRLAQRRSPAALAHRAAAAPSCQCRRSRRPTGRPPPRRWPMPSSSWASWLRPRPAGRGGEAGQLAGGELRQKAGGHAGGAAAHAACSSCGGIGARLFGLCTASTSQGLAQPCKLGRGSGRVGQARFGTLPCSFGQICRSARAANQPGPRQAHRQAARDLLPPNLPDAKAASAAPACKPIGEALTGLAAPPVLGGHAHRRRRPPARACPSPPRPACLLLLLLQHSR